MSDLIVLCVVLFALNKLEKELPHYDRNRDIKVVVAELAEPRYCDRSCENLYEDSVMCSKNRQSDREEHKEH